ncbi:MAG: spermidine synthase [Planctomycetaceae bacterium]
MTSSLMPSPDRWLLHSPKFARVAPLGSGVISGTGVFVWTHQFLATFGCSLPVTAGLTMALAAGVAVAWWGLGQRNSLAPIMHYTQPAAWFTLAVWTVSFPALLNAASRLVSRLPGAWFEVEATAFAVLLVAASVLFVIPVAAIAWVGSHSTADQSQRAPLDRPFSIRFAAGCGLGLGAAPVLWAPRMSVEHIGFAVTACAAVALWVSLLRASESGTRGATIRRETPESAARDGFPSPAAWIASASLLAGLLIPVVSRLVMQFLPGCSFTHFAFWSGLLCGIAGGAAWAGRLGHHRPDSIGRDGVIIAGLLLAVWPVTFLLLSPLLLHGMLSLNAFVSQVGMLSAVRWLTAFVGVLPLGIAAGRIWAHGRPAYLDTLQTFDGAVGCLCLAAGTVLMESLWISPRNSVVLLVPAAITLIAARLWMRERSAFERRHWVGGVTAVAIVAALPAALLNYRPDVTAKLLFSTQTFIAYNVGIDRELLPHLDDGRLVDLRDGRDAVWTIWKHRGSQLQLRQNGLPIGIVSTNPRICPQFAGDIMPAVVPLVVHPQPDRVLVLGLGSTATVSTCLACPVREVTCLEGDRGLIRINAEIIAPASGFNPLEDDRVKLRAVDPTLALLVDDGRYDVVLIGDALPYLFDQSSQFTSEFYERVNEHLYPGGLICQRLQYADFGRGPIETMLATLRSVFPQVFCLESAPGEMLLLASNSKEPLFDEALVKRCEAAHVRRLLAQLGWDWSVLLNMAAIGPEQVDELFTHDVQVNTVGNGAFAYGLPQEMMRWGPKWQEIQQLLAQRGGRMLDWIGQTPKVQEIAKRLEDMTEQHKLIVENPDHYWAYRKTLKERLEERPRSMIQPVHHELKRTLHPEDERRKEYLVVLGAAATGAAPDPSAIALMTNFAEPYDPLVSYFLHEEAARLYERAVTTDHKAQFDHLRYSVHFGPQQDRSVRNVVAALDLLIDNPELIDDPRQRWDELNGLLDVLRQRSSLRVQNDRTASPFELVDAEKSIRAAERAMRAMDRLCAAADVVPSDWERRRTVLQRLLIRPMWTYHGKQAGRLAALEARKQKTADAQTESTQTQ